MVDRDRVGAALVRQRLWYLWCRSVPKAICLTNRVWWLDCGCALAGSASAVVVSSAPADTTATAASFAVRLLLGMFTP